MKLPATMGLTLEALESVVGFKIDRLVDARVSEHGAVYIDLIINAEREELKKDEQVN
jgi:hypothetical protein